MEHKDSIKTARTKSYFINAAKQIILEEGATSVSVRKVAEIAGYSYATLYHYFSDLDSLMFAVKTQMIKEMVQSMDMDNKTTELTLEDIKVNNRRFLEFFINNRNIYDFLYRYQLKNSSVPGFDNQDLGERYYHTYSSFVAKGIIKKSDIPIIAKTLIYGMYGLLTLYFLSNGLTIKMLYHDMDEMTDHLLKGKHDGH